MNFDLTNEQRDIKKAARDFAVGEFTDVARDYDLNETFPIEIIDKARKLGFIGLFIPEKYGGPGFGFLEQALVLEEFWRVDPGISQQLCSVTFGAEEFLLYGTEEQKMKYLPPLFEGDSIMGFAITEPDAGSDTAAATTRAVKEGNEYVINGNKVMIGNGTKGTFMLVYCLTNPEEKKKGLDKIMEHYGRSTVNVYDEKHVKDIVVLRLTIDKLTGKQSGNWDK